MTRYLLAIAVVVGAIGAGPQQAKAQELWGAVVVGPDGAYGWSSNQWTEQAAESLAMDYCQGQCTQGFTFYDSCGAISVAWDQAFMGHGDTQEVAEAEALYACHIEMDGGCEIMVWACTD